MARKGKGKGKAGLSFAQRAAAIRQVANDIADAGMHVTDTIRSAASRLGRRNPKSQHIQALAFDTRAKTPAQADAVMAQQRAVFARKGLVEGRDYTFRDEVRNPSGWATAKHVHTQFTPAGLARYQGLTQPDAVTNVAANVPTPTARPSLPGDAAFADPRSTAAEAAPAGPPPGGLRPGFTGSSLAPSFAAPGPGTIGGLLGRPSAGLGFMPGSGSLAPDPAPPSAERLGRSTTSDLANLTEAIPADRPAPTTRMGVMNVPVNEARSFTPDLNKMGIVTPGMLGQPTATAEASSLPDTGPTLADRAVRENITSSLPDIGPTLADRPAARTVAKAQPAATALDAIDAMAGYGEDATPVKNVVDQAQPATPDVADDTGAYPPAPAEYKPDAFSPDAYKTGLGATAKATAKGLLGGGLPGALFGGLGSLISQNMPSGFNEAVPESSRFSVGSGLSGINAALSGPKGATATSRTQKGASVTSLGNGQSLRRSDRFGWTEVVGPDGSVVGIQYDNPTGKGILGKSILGSRQGLFGWASNKAGSTFGGSNGLSPSASRAIRDKTDGGLY